MQFERAVRDELRREAASVRTPDDMWDKISRQIDHEEARARRIRSWQLSPAVGSGVALAVAMGMLFFTLMPAEVNDGRSVPQAVARPVVLAPSRPPANVTAEPPAHLPPADPPEAIPIKSIGELPRQPHSQVVVSAEPGPSRLPGTVAMVPR